MLCTVWRITDLWFPLRLGARGSGRPGAAGRAAAGGADRSGQCHQSVIRKPMNAMPKPIRMFQLASPPMGSVPPEM